MYIQGKKQPENHFVLRLTKCFIIDLSGFSPTDMRGKHTNRPHAFTADQVQKILDHIRSFRGGRSHYSLHDTSRTVPQRGPEYSENA